LTGIDGRYVLNYEPPALREILRWYDVELHGSAALLVRRGTPLAMEWAAGAAASAKWDEWLDVPTLDGALTTARVRIERTLWGKAMLLAAKEAPVHVDYGLPDGTVRTHRIVPDLVAEGMWVSPYVERITPEWSGVPVERIRFRAEGQRSFRHELRLTWTTGTRP
jgi:hypothetical protein